MGRLDPGRTPRLEPFNHMVPCDAEQVAGDGTLRDLKSSRLQQRKKRFLDDVVGCRTPAHARGVLIDPALITAEQLAECRFIALTGPPEQRRVVHIINLIAYRHGKSSKSPGPPRQETDGTAAWTPRPCRFC
jgi:hypothetical protein